MVLTIKGSYYWGSLKIPLTRCTTIIYDNDTWNHRSLRNENPWPNAQSSRIMEVHLIALSLIVAACRRYKNLNSFHRQSQKNLQRCQKKVKRMVSRTNQSTSQCLTSVAGVIGFGRCATTWNRFTGNPKHFAPWAFVSRSFFMVRAAT